MSSSSLNKNVRDVAPSHPPEGTSPGESRDCPVCYEPFHPLNGSSIIINEFCKVDHPHPQEPIAIPLCDHEFCRQCLREHCQYSISVRKLPIKCPAKASEDCQNNVPISHVRAVLLGETLNESTLGHQTPLSQASEEVSSISTKGHISQSHCSPPVSDLRPSNPDSPLCNRYGSLGSEGIVRDNSMNHLAEAQDLRNWIKFQKLHRLFHDDSLTFCTRCEEVVSIYADECPPDSESNSRNRSKDESKIRNGSSCRLPIKCHACGHSFCAIHGDAHPNTTCHQYLKTYRQNKEVRKSERLIQRYCKPCSHCQAPIHKASGCDHIICPSCYDDMCFKCGTHLYLEGQSMVRSCQRCNQTFIDHRYMGRYRLFICLIFTICMPFYILHVAIVGTFALLSCGCFCCLGCGIQRKESAKDSSLQHSDEKVSIAMESSSNGSNIQFIFRPKVAIRIVLEMIFLPFLDLLDQCGVSSCCNPDTGMMESGWKEEEVDSDEDDVERQVRLNSTMTTEEECDEGSRNRTNM